MEATRKITLDPDGWILVGEGGATLVFKYAGAERNVLVSFSRFPIKECKPSARESWC